jgi:hypothetical protein
LYYQLGIANTTTAQWLPVRVHDGKKFKGSDMLCRKALTNYPF